MQFHSDRLKAPTQTLTGWTWRQEWTATSYIFQLGAAVLMMQWVVMQWGITHDSAIVWERFSLSDDIKTSLQCVTLWTVILKSLHTLHSPFFPLIFTALFAPTSQSWVWHWQGCQRLLSDNIPRARVQALNTISYLVVKMLNNCETISAIPYPWIFTAVVVFPALVAVSEAACQWVTTRSKTWLTCFMWHFNFLSVNQCSCCISLIALVDWQLMIDLVFG